MNSIESTLQQFHPVSLPELEKVALLDRMDTKYVFTRQELPLYLEKLKDDYSILEIDGLRMFRYESLYFDTADFSLYNHHYCGRLNRYKVRFRKYVESDLSYFEIKFKNSKGRTIKNRILHKPEEVIEGKTEDLLHANSPIKADGLQAKMWVNYKRITLVSNDFKERLTLDLDLSFIHDDNTRSFDDLIIAEVKQSKCGHSVFSRLMKQKHVRKGSISKYCYGVASLFSNIRKNNFKPQIQYLNRILYASPAGPQH